MMTNTRDSSTQLRQRYRVRVQKIKQVFDRSLHLEDCTLDTRRERASCSGINAGVSIHNSLL